MTMRAPLAHCMVNWDDRAKEFCELFEIYRLFPNMTLCPSTYLPAGDPDAFLNTQNGGQFVRPSADTVSDVFGNIVSLENNQIAYCGGLVVKNVADAMREGEWTPLTAGSGSITDNGDGSITFTSTGSGDRAFLYGGDITLNHDYRMVLIIDEVSGDPGNYHAAINGGSPLNRKLFTTTGTKALELTTAGVGGLQARFGIGCTAVCTGAGSVTISKVLVVDVTNWPDYAKELIPEHVSVWVGDGVELVPSTTFEDWADSTVPDGWTKGHTPDANNYVEENANGMRVVSDGTWVSVALDENVIEGQTYAYSITVTNTTGDITFINTDGATIVRPTSSGTSTGTFVAAGTGTIDIKRTGACDVVVNELTVQRVPSNANYDGVQYLTEFPSQGADETTGEVFDFDENGEGPNLLTGVPELFANRHYFQSVDCTVTPTDTTNVILDPSSTNGRYWPESAYFPPTTTSTQAFLVRFKVKVTTARQVRFGVAELPWNADGLTTQDITAGTHELTHVYIPDGTQTNIYPIIYPDYDGGTDPLELVDVKICRFNLHAGHSFSDGYGPNLILNGGFDGANPWSIDNDLSISGGVARIDATAATVSTLLQTIETIVGKTYEYKLNVTENVGASGEARLEVRDSTSLLASETLSAATGEYSLTFIATETTSDIRFRTLTTIDQGDAVSLDNAVVREVLETPGYCYRADGTNQVIYSNDGTQWTQNNVTRSDATSIFPDKTASTFTCDTTASVEHRVYEGCGTITNTTQYCMWAIVEYTNNQWVKLRSDYPSSYSSFDIENGVTGTLNADHDAFGIKPLGGNRYKIWVVWTATSTGSGNTLVSIGEDTDAAADTFTAAGTESIIVHHMQLEEGAVPTSAIHTDSGASVSRNAPTTFSLDDSLWPDSAGAMIFEFIPEYDSDHPDNHGLVVVRDNIFSLCYDVNAVGTLRSYDGTNTATANGLTWSAGELVKYLLRWSDDFGVYALCEDTSTDTDDDKTFEGTFLPDGNGIRFGYSSTVSFKIKRFAIFSVDPKLDRLKELAE